MTCRELSDFVLDYVAGELPAALCDAFERHLDACGTCQIYLATYRATVRASRAALADEPALPQMPEDLVRAIVAAAGKWGK